MGTNKKAYMREYSRRRRLGKIEEPRPQLPRKKDIFEVAAMLKLALQAVMNSGYDVSSSACTNALAAYKEYWEEDN